MPKLRYLDFDLCIEHGDRGFLAKVLRSPAGEAQGTFDLPFSADRLENLVIKLGWMRHGTRRFGSAEMDAARELGGKLFDAVFAGELGSCFRASFESAAAQDDRGLRIRLRLQGAPELANLPWEYLYDRSKDRFLVQSVQTPLVRYIEMAESIKPTTASLPLRVLVVAVNPPRHPALEVEKELALLGEALAPLIEHGRVAITTLRNAGPSELQRRLRAGAFNVFHFIGHGTFDQKSDEGILLLVDAAGEALPVGAHRIGTLLHDHRSLRLAVLNSCEGARSSQSDPLAGVAATIVRQGIPAVVAMQFEISDAAAVTFAGEFYSALADGYPVDGALAEARKAIYYMPNDVEWGTPVLYLRSPDGVLFEWSARGDDEEREREREKREREKREREEREREEREREEREREEREREERERAERERAEREREERERAERENAERIEAEARHAAEARAAERQRTRKKRRRDADAEQAHPAGRPAPAGRKAPVATATGAALSLEQWWALLGAHAVLLLAGVAGGLAYPLDKAVRTGVEVAGLEIFRLGPIGSFAFPLGAIACGAIADRVGRRNALLGSSALLSVALAVGGAAGWLFLDVVTFLRGGVFVAAVLFAAESWPALHRARALAVVACGGAVGALVAGLVAPTPDPPAAWRPMLLVPAALGAVLVLALRPVLREPGIWEDERGPAHAQLRAPQGPPPRVVALSVFTVMLTSLGAWALPRLASSSYPAWQIDRSVGVIGGALALGFVADRFGRRLAFPGFVLGLGCVALLLTWTGDSPPVLAAFVTGLFSVSSSLAFAIIIPELLPTLRRGLYFGLIAFGAGSFDDLVRYVVDVDPSVGTWIGVVAFAAAALLARRLPEGRGTDLRTAGRGP